MGEIEVGLLDIVGMWKEAPNYPPRPKPILLGPLFGTYSLEVFPDRVPMFHRH